MTDEPFDPATFHMDFPLWVIVDEERLLTRGLVSAIPPFNAPAVKRYVALFTDDDLAQQVIDVVPLPGKRPLPIPSAADLLDLLTALKKAGVTHGGLDFTYGERGSTVMLATIDQFIAAARGAGS